MKWLFVLPALMLCAFMAAPGPRWELLGSRVVNYSLDHDEILVTGAEGKFDAVKIKVLRAPLNMRRVVVHFANGTEQDLAIRDNFRAGSESRVIDLTGNDRIIRRISLWYDTKNASRKKALVEVWGRH
ncbi:MAG: DUF2541 family protein [Bacteroidetes bacterium]|nr:DUF2541 family protein [Bacteroidota bacterium]